MSHGEGCIPIGQFTFLPVARRWLYAGSMKFIAHALFRVQDTDYKRCYFLANYSDRGMALCGDTTIVLMGSCLPLGITYPCFTRDGKKRKAVKGLRIRIGSRKVSRGPIIL